jgi:tripartite ATP-independent transporter DctP family solute receptor
MSTPFRKLPVALAALLLVAACSDGGGAGSASAPPASVPPASEVPSDAPSAPASQAAATLDLAHSYQDAQPQHACGAKVIADSASAANVGLTIQIFGASQLGGDADRIASVAAGDIDIDIQGASALSALYAPMSVVDGAFVFDDADHLHRFFTEPASQPLKDGFLEATGVRILGAWSAGARQFTANKAIRTPEDLQGLRMRFPPSPQFLMNAEAMGASAVEVAFEELYLALQQGTVDGQENPINNIAANNIQEVQDVMSMSSHQLNSNLVVINEDKWASLSPEQQAALTAAVESAMAEVPQCVEEFESETLEQWKVDGTIEIVEDVDREAFQTKAEAFLRENFTAEQVPVLEAIRSVAE